MGVGGGYLHRAVGGDVGAYVGVGGAYLHRVVGGLAAGAWREIAVLIQHAVRVGRHHRPTHVRHVVLVHHRVVQRLHHPRAHVPKRQVPLPVADGEGIHRVRGLLRGELCRHLRGLLLLLRLVLLLRLLLLLLRLVLRLHRLLLLYREAAMVPRHQLAGLPKARGQHHAGGLHHSTGGGGLHHLVGTVRHRHAMHRANPLSPRVEIIHATFINVGYFDIPSLEIFVEELFFKEYLIP